MTIKEIGEILGKWPKTYKKLALFGIITGGGILSIFFFILSFFLQVKGDPESTVGAWMVRIFSLCILGIAVFAIRETKNKFAKLKKIIESIINNPQNIVWVYREITRVGKTNIASFNKLHFYLKDKTNEIFNVKVDDAVKIMEYFKNNLKEMSLGWDAKLETVFKDNPLKLKEERVRIDEVRHTTVRVRYVPGQ